MYEEHSIQKQRIDRFEFIFIWNILQEDHMLDYKISLNKFDHTKIILSTFYDHKLSEFRRQVSISIHMPVMNFPVIQTVKNLPAMRETRVWSRVGWSPGEGNGNPLPYSCLENPMDRGAWQATVHGVITEWLTPNDQLGDEMSKRMAFKLISVLFTVRYL